MNAVLEKSPAYPYRMVAGNDEAAAVVARVLANCRAVMITTEAGVIEDRDIEALHDFRVAIRRTRSLLKTLGGLFDSGPVRRFMDDFAWLARAAGRQRDLDVFLSQFEEKQNIPDVDAGTLLPVRMSLQRRRRAAQTQLLRVLRSPRYRSLKTDWFHFLDRLRHDVKPGARAREVLNAAMLSSYEQVRSRGDGLRPGSKAERLHALRKDAKELRYLLDAFGDLHDVDAIARLTRALKRLQDALGGVCDLQVQMDMLAEIAAGLPVEVATWPAQQRALRRWRSLLRARQTEERTRFARHYARFTRKRNRRLFKELFTEIRNP